MDGWICEWPVPHNLPPHIAENVVCKFSIIMNVGIWSVPCSASEALVFCCCPLAY